MGTQMVSRCGGGELGESRHLLSWDCREVKESPNGFAEDTRSTRDVVRAKESPAPDGGEQDPWLASCRGHLLLPCHKPSASWPGPHCFCIGKAALTKAREPNPSPWSVPPSLGLCGDGNRVPCPTGNTGDSPVQGAGRGLPSLLLPLWAALPFLTSLVLAQSYW